ncbi:uncharacterized protein A4U43_C07F3860 [Asparagus officinalis]|uniref:EF-hand domain-containing protein n=1 Tax=Asparagus officinalis TaxID=4686 RepID=A0A5P1E9A2_ASPOF|nr:mitochondrial substrate carrier family protein C-like isoform X2 [Asparagus officinalis]ONK62438.1 uncharacterized protein A4U43_C07F3860 [Asparagus officinalis]
MASLPSPLESFFQNPLKFLSKFDKSPNKKPFSKKGEDFSLDSFISSALDGLIQNLVMLDQDRRRISGGIVMEREEIGGFLSNLGFARIGGPRSSSESLNAASMEELIELVPQLSDKEKQFSVREFLQCTQNEGRQLFEELDRNKDGQVTLEDLEIAMSKRRLPKRYARELLRCTRRHLFSKSISWKEFLSLMEQKELAILRAYSTLSFGDSLTPQGNQIAGSLRIAGAPENEDNTVSLMHYLNVDNGESISYSQFRNFMLLLPSEQLEGDRWNKCHDGGNAVEPLAQSVLKSALAGGIACSFSAFVMHPVDTVKTCVQASTLSLPELFLKLPEFGFQGLYKGSIPAVIGQFTSHGLRTGLGEVSKSILTKAIPGLPDIQVQSLASFSSTVLGTTYRVPFEVLKQRLQAGMFDNVGEAAIVTLHQDGMKGFFRGTGATLCRELPFYVLGAGLYEEAKKAVQKVLRRDLEPWETVVVGAVTGGLASVLTTPFDVIKTRMMTAPQGMQITMKMAAITILREEGPLALFRGALPRFFWVAPLGAMNFAGYELLRKTMDRTSFLTGNQHSKKRLAGKA